MTQDMNRLAAEIAALGSELGPDQAMRSAALLAPLHESEPYRGVTLARDLRYGPDPRNRLDVITPGAEGDRLPVLAFVHGGGFVRGDKRTPGTPYHDNVALFAARHGMVGVNLTYRLAPDHQWPSGPEDMAAAVGWLRAEIGRHGGDPARIFLMGTSAGAVHVASYVAHPAFHAAPGGGLAGAILLSGIYDFGREAPDPRHNAYLGDDVSRHAERSSLDGLLATALPLLYVVTEHDPAMFVGQTLAVLDRTFARTGRLPRFVHLLGHNHFTASLHLNTADDRLGREIERFVAACPPAP